MSDIESGDVLRLGCSLSYENVHEIANVYHCLVTGGADKTFTEIVDDIQEYCDGLVQDLDTLFNTNILADKISVANVTQGLVFGAIDWGVFTQGGSAADPTAVGVCCLAYARTYVPRVQIRKYYGVFGETQMTDGVWAATVRDACATAMAYHITPQTLTDGLILLGVAYNRNLLSYTLGQSVVTAAEPTYQRRRRRGRGS